MERLLELHFKYLDRVRTVDDQIEREKTVRALSCISSDSFSCFVYEYSHSKVEAKEIKEQKKVLCFQENTEITNKTKIQYLDN